MVFGEIRLVVFSQIACSHLLNVDYPVAVRMYFARFVMA